MPKEQKPRNVRPDPTRLATPAKPRFVRDEGLGALEFEGRYPPKTKGYMPKTRSLAEQREQGIYDD